MSYPRDLDELSEDELAGELMRRLGASRRGVCDYCGRHPGTRACKFPERHARTRGWRRIVIEATRTEWRPNPDDAALDAGAKEPKP